MPIRPNLIERTLFYTLNQGPAPMLEVFSMLSFRAALAGARLGVFDALEDGPRSAGDLARTLKTDERGIKTLLDALVPLGYLDRDGAVYSNTRLTSRWMARRSPTTIVHALLYWGDILFALWGDLEESIRRGKPVTPLYEWIEGQPQTSAHFQQFMLEAAALAEGEFVSKLKLPPGARRLIDVGGGHGTWSIALCKRYPDLHATVFDAPRALVSAQENIAAKGMGARVTVQAGNFMTDDLGSGYDAALLINIIHGLTPEENAALLRRVGQALRAGGRVYILEQLQGRALLPTAEAANALFGLSYYHLLGGSVYAYADIMSWLQAAGYDDARRVNLLRIPGNSIISAAYSP